MAFVAGKGARIFLGQHDLSPMLRNASVSMTKDALDTTTFQDGARDYIEGLKNGTATLSGLFDAAAASSPTNAGSDQILKAAFDLSSTTPVSIFPGGDVNSASVLSFGYETDSWDGAYETGAAFDGVVTVAATIQANGGWSRRFAAVPYPSAAYTAIQTFTAWDNVTTSANGLVATFHVPFYTSGTYTVILEDSPDAVTYTPRITRNITAAGVFTDSWAGTVQRHVRGRISAVGAGGFFHVNVGR